MTPRRLRGTWIPERGEVIWIDHNPQAGREMRDHHPFLVLSSATFQAAVGLVVGCAMTSAPYNHKLLHGRGSWSDSGSAGCPQLRTVPSAEILRLEGSRRQAPSHGGGAG